MVNKKDEEERGGGKGFVFPSVKSSASLVSNIDERAGNMSDYKK